MADGWDEIRPYIRTGEHVYWVGRPDPAVRFTPADGLLIPFSVFWCGFVFFSMFGVISSDAPASFTVWAIPFILVGLYMVIGRFFYKTHRKRHTVYALTDQRAMVAIGTSLADSPVINQPVTTRRSRDRSHASVSIGSSGSWMRQEALYANTGLDFFRRGSSPIAFYDVANPDAMLTALERARRRAE